MLRSITLKNFRAFRQQTFEFSKLNIFVGPNNSGKSSALSAINLIAQTVIQSSFDSAPLLINGQFDELGTFIDIVHGNRSNTPIGIDLRYDQYELKLEFKFRTQRREIELQRFHLFDKGKSLVNYQQKKDGFNIDFFGNPFETVFPNIPKRRPRFRGFWPTFFLRSGAGFGVALQDQNRSDRESDLARKVDYSLFQAERRLFDLFRNFDSLSPFRDQPQRTYLYTGETASNIGRTGTNTIALLSADASKRGGERSGLIEQISRWLSVTGIAKSIIVKNLTPRHFEICLENVDGSEHNICDVGFGCSQVLPVLTAGLRVFARSHTMARATPMLIVQEPEIHLHPNAQASLGSFFSSLILEKGQIFIETHSDNLVLRVARHVALKELQESDVNIFYVSNAKESRRVVPMSITNQGTFRPDWPDGFFPQRQTESLELARARLKADKEPVQGQFNFTYPEER